MFLVLLPGQFLPQDRQTNITKKHYDRKYLHTIYAIMLLNMHKTWKLWIIKSLTIEKIDFETQFLTLKGARGFLKPYKRLTL